MLTVKNIKEIVQMYNLGISPRRLGQCFLVAPKMLERIARAGEITPEDTVLEIGPGLGALTDELVQTGAAIHAVEKDPRFVNVLNDRMAAHNNVDIVHSDILKIQLESYAQSKEHSLVVMGNIPYSLTSPILDILLKQRKWIKSIVLMIQKEVALRLVAEPGTKAYSSLSVMVQVAFKPKVCFHVPPSSFYPQPKVTSSVIRLEPLSEALVPAEEQTLMLRMVRALFTHRRKTLVNAFLMSGLGYTKDQILAALEAAEIDPEVRPEMLHLADFQRVARALPN